MHLARRTCGPTERRMVQALRCVLTDDVVRIHRPAPGTCVHPAPRDAYGSGRVEADTISLAYARQEGSHRVGQVREAETKAVTVRAELAPGEVHSTHRHAMTKVLILPEEQAQRGVGSGAGVSVVSVSVDGWSRCGVTHDSNPERQLEGSEASTAGP